MEELLETMKKNCEALQKELKSAKVYSDQIQILESTKSRMVKELLNLQKEQDVLEVWIKKERAAQIARIDQAEAEALTLKTFLESERAKVQQEYIKAQSLQLRAEAEMKEAVKVKEQSMEAIKTYNDKVEKFKNLANA
jgi:hypothetical protein